MLVGDTAALRFVKKTLRPCYERYVPSSELAALAQRAQSGDAAARHELLVELYRAVRKHVYLVIGGAPPIGGSASGLTSATTTPRLEKWSVS